MLFTGTRGQRKRYLEMRARMEKEKKKKKKRVTLPSQRFVLLPELWRAPTKYSQEAQSCKAALRLDMFCSPSFSRENKTGNTTWSPAGRRGDGNSWANSPPDIQQLRGLEPKKRTTCSREEETWRSFSSSLFSALYSCLSVNMPLSVSNAFDSDTIHQKLRKGLFKLPRGGTRPTWRAQQPIGEQEGACPQSKWFMSL